MLPESTPEWRPVAWLPNGIPYIWQSSKDYSAVWNEPPRLLREILESINAR